MCGAHGVTSKRCWYPGRDHIYTRCMSLASRRWRNMIETYVLETWRDGTKHTCFGHMLPLISTNDFKVLKISGCLYIIHDAFWENEKKRVSTRWTWKHPAHTMEHVQWHRNAVALAQHRNASAFISKEHCRSYLISATRYEPILPTTHRRRDRILDVVQDVVKLIRGQQFCNGRSSIFPVDMSYSMGFLHTALTIYRKVTGMTQLT